MKIGHLPGGGKRLVHGKKSGIFEKKLTFRALGFGKTGGKKGEPQGSVFSKKALGRSEKVISVFWGGFLVGHFLGRPFSRQKKREKKRGGFFPGKKVPGEGSIPLVFPVKN